MKKTFKYIMASLVAASSLTMVSCIDETQPTSSLTQEQLNSSLKATEALLWGLPAKMVAFEEAVGDYHYDWGFGSVMHIHDVMGDEYAVTSSSYDWYDSWENNQYMSENYLNQQLVWQTYYKQILTANSLIGAIDPETASDAMKGSLAVGYAYRAFTYLDAARMYEFLPNDGTEAVNSDGNNVQGLTIPIVTEKTTEEAVRNNPRATHYEMFKFIMDDLDQAEEWIPFLTVSEKAIPHLEVVYGLKARAYMWHASFLEELGDTENGGVPSDTLNTKALVNLTANQAYKLAAEYAEKAIGTNGKDRILTKAQWLDTSAGFNTPVASWMFCMGLVKENDAVQSGIINWTSWCSNETDYGYASAGPLVCASAAMYESMSDYDFRKLSYKAPAGTRLEGQEPRLVNDETFAAFPNYASLKFRPGGANMSDFNVGSSVYIPLMRIEEMFFIKAEALAQANDITGAIDVLKTIMLTRNPRYVAPEANKDAVIEEVIRQKMVEFWGEGINFYDYKRLNIPVTRIYEGTNFNKLAQFNTTTRPAWMNYVIVRNEGTNNKAVKNWNNPDPSDCYASAAKENNYAANPFEVNAKARGLKKPISVIK